MEQVKQTEKDLEEASAKSSLDAFDVLGTIGMGMFSRVRLVRNKEDAAAKPMAMKIFKKSLLIKKKHVANVHIEKELLERLAHPAIPQLLGTHQDSRFVFFLMEYISGGELFSRMQKLGKLPIEQVKFYAAQLVLVLEYLHLEGIAFRDLKPENILIDKEGYLKLIDFGFARQNTGKLYTLCGTPEYLAPEIIMCKGHSKEVDWWALGIILYEMLVGTSPFFDPSPMNIYQKIILGRYCLPDSVEASAAQLIRQLLETDPDKRAGCKEAQYPARTHLWFDQTNFEELEQRRVEPPWVPDLQSDYDTSYFQNYPDSFELPPVPNIQSRDPFEGF